LRSPIKFECKRSTIEYAVGIKYSMSDLICDVISYRIWRCDIRKIANMIKHIKIKYGKYGNKCIHEFLSKIGLALEFKSFRRQMMKEGTLTSFTFYDASQFCACAQQLTLQIRSRRKYLILWQHYSFWLTFQFATNDLWQAFVRFIDASVVAYFLHWGPPCICKRYVFICSAGYFNLLSNYQAKLVVKWEITLNKSHLSRDAYFVCIKLKYTLMLML